MSQIDIPPAGTKISANLAIPDNPIIPFIEGDGVGVDITPVMIEVANAAVAKAYGSARQIHWMEVYCGEKAIQRYGSSLPQETLDTLREYMISIKGPLSGGIRPLDAVLRQQLDLSISLRPIRWCRGIPSPVKRPDLVNMAIFRENTEDSYAGIEWDANSAGARKIIEFLQREMGVKKIRVPDSTSIGIKPVSRESTERLIRKAIQYATDNHRKSVTLVHMGNVMKSTEGMFRNWGYELAKREFGGIEIDGGPQVQLPNGIVINDRVADAFLQQILLHPEDYDVIATLNLNGDYIADALAAEVGGIGIAPGAHFSDHLACFEATHGTVPKYAGQNKINPGSMILSAELLLRHIGWKEAADRIGKGIHRAIDEKIVTCDFARLMDNAKEVSSSEFGRAVIDRM